MKIKFTFSNNLELVYNLHDTASAKFFAESIQQLAPSDICPTSFKNGFDSELYIPERILRLYTVADSINSLYPNQVNIILTVKTAIKIHTNMLLNKSTNHIYLCHTQYQTFSHLNIERPPIPKPYHETYKQDDCV